MWDIDLGAVPAGPSLDAHQNLLNLRETAAEFLFKANSVFFSNSSTPAQDQTPDPTELLVDSPSHSSSGNTIPSSPPYATPNKTPPDKQICPSIARLTHVATTNWNIDYSVVQIVTGVIFAIVFLFLQTFHLGSSASHVKPPRTTALLTYPLLRGKASPGNHRTVHAIRHLHGEQA